MAKLNRISAAVMAVGMVGAPFAALAQANTEAVAVSLSAVMTTGEVTTTASDVDVNTTTGAQVNFFASAAATGAVVYAASNAASDSAAAVAGAIAPGSVEDLGNATSVTAEIEGTVTITFDTTTD